VILLDTNVISEFMLPVPDARVTDWLDRQPRSSIWTSSINLYEIRAGLLTMPPGRRRVGLESHFERILQVAIQSRILHFDAESAERAAELSAERRRLGRPVEIRDTMIAGIVLASHAKLATRNVKHFEEIASSVVNPWDRS
jgi:predicted nucleic acid-binding protein